MRCFRAVQAHGPLRAVGPAVLGIILLLWVGPLWGTTLVPVNFPELVERSPVIVHATVVGSSSHWNADRTLIVTDIELQVLEALRGNPGGTITVTQLGGQVGKVRVDVDGAAPFLVGEEVVLFLSGSGTPSGANRDALTPEASGTRGASSTLRLVGMSQGRYQVHRDEATGKKWIHGMSASGRASVGIAASGTPGTAAPSPPGPAVTAGSRMELSGFLEGIRTRVREITPETPRETDR